MSPKRRLTTQQGADPAHAAGKRKKAPPPGVGELRRKDTRPGRDQPWVPTSGLIGRKRRSARRS